MRFSRNRSGFRKSNLGFFIAAFLFVIATLAGAEDPKPVRITFLPPPMEGTLSLGIYDQKGRLVRVLAREATEKDFTIGLNGLITFWDGKDDAGKSLSAGTYEARGLSVGTLEVEGVALHGNDWITDEEAPRPTRIADLQLTAPDEIGVTLATADGAARIASIALATEASLRMETKFEVKIIDGRVQVSGKDGLQTFPLGEGELAIDAAPGTTDRWWMIVQTPTGREVRAFTSSGEFLRRLAYAPGDPQPRRILAARGTFAERWSEQIVLWEENEQLQRVRILALPKIAAVGSAPVWATVLEKAIWRGATFEAIKPLLRRPDGKSFTPEKEFVVRLINNPLIKDEPSTAHVTIGFNEHGSFLQTTDGLPLRRLTETLNLQWAVIGREGSGKLLTIFQSDGGVVEEFKARKLANMMAFDAGDFEWAPPAAK